MKDDFNFDFDYEEKDLNSFSSEPKEEKTYEDIVSDSAYSFAVGTPQSRPQGGAYSRTVYRKKKSGGFSYKLRRWWSRLKKGQKAAIISLTSVILALLLLIVWFFTYFNYNYRAIDESDLGFDGVINEKIINIALFGIDSRDEDSFEGLSDSIMIMSLNTETKKVKIISLMRDTLVPIEKDGKTTYNKLTTAYKSGGPELSIKTINKCFGLDISEYATVNFYGMADIIDAVGGIDATLTEREVKARGNNNHGINDMIEEVCQYMDKDPKDYYITVAGEQHLNGIQAVAYARIRYVPNVWGTNNDYGRTDRQRYVMEQLFNKATQMKKTQYVKLAKSLIPCSETSLSYGEIMDLAVNILLHSPTFEQSRVPQDDWNMTSPSGSFGSVVYFDLDYAAKAIHSIIYDDKTMDQFVEENPVEKNDWYGKRGYSSSGSSSNKPTTSSTPTPTESSDPTPSSNTPSSTPSEVSEPLSTPPENEDGEGTEGDTEGGTEGDTGGEIEGGIEGGTDGDTGGGTGGATEDGNGTYDQPEYE